MNHFDRFIRTELCLSEATISAYKKDVSEFLQFCGENSITALIIHDFLSSLRARHLKSSTIKRKLMSIRCLCRHLISSGLLSKEVISSLDPVRTERNDGVVISDEDICQALSFLNARLSKPGNHNIYRNISVILILFDSGLRVSELCNLNIGDVKQNRQIFVQGKGGKQRIVPTTSRSVEALSDYINLERQSDSNALFVKSDGNRITRLSIKDMISSLFQRVLSKQITPHDLRKSCATMLLRNGLDIELVQRILGHENLVTTQTYLHVEQKDLVETHRLCHPFGERVSV